MSWTNAIWLQLGIGLGMSLVSIWLVMFYLHKTLTHKTFRVTSPTFDSILLVSTWLTHFGSSAYQWAISHRLHHMFGDVPGLDPYSSIERGHWRIFWGSAYYLHAYNQRPEHDQLFPDLALKPWQKSMYQHRKFVIVPLVVIFWGIPFTLYRGPLWAVPILLFTGFIGGAIPTLTALLGGGLINSLAHSWKGKIGVWLKWYKVRKSLDGTTAANRPWWAIFIPELWHRNHHDQADKGNFGWRHPWCQLDWVFLSGLGLQGLGLVKEGFTNITHDRAALKEWVRTWHERGADLTDAEVAEMVDFGLAALHGQLQDRAPVGSAA